jgi:bifunctional oligoribonuclease and PAP phosphatase NrnA
MEPTPKQQAVDLIKRSQRILVVPGHPDGDSVGSALACLIVLTKLGKEASVALIEPVSHQYRFLPRVTDITQDVNGVRDFIITLDNPSVETDKLSYNFDDGKLNIIITPKRGRYQSDDVTVRQGAFKYDLVITLDAPHVGMLGEIHERYPTLFQEVPVVNIDHHASNANFGAVNLVDLSATSTAEILIGVIESLGVDLIDADVATALLTGIIADTGSFQNANTTPKSLTVAAQLVGLGARRQEIIKQLFKTKSLAMLKLWGQILANVQFDAEHKLVWGTAGLEDLAATGATEHDFAGLIDELMTSIPGADVVLLLSERQPRVISGSVRTAKGVDAAEICGLFGGGGHPGAAGFRMLDLALAEALPIVLEKMRAYQAKRLGLAQAAMPETVVTGESGPSPFTS